MTIEKDATLTKKFNEITVKKGDTFQVDLEEGGLLGVMWDAQLVSGKATLLEDTCKEIFPGACDGPILHRKVYRAEEAGEIKIVAKSQYSNVTFKVRVN